MAKRWKTGSRHNDSETFELTGDLFARPAERSPESYDFLVAGEALPDFEVSAPAAGAGAVPTPEDIHRLRVDELSSRRKIHYISFGSGSSGNSSYIGDDETGLLIDAGVEPDKIYDALDRHGLSVKNIKGICLTHDHSDHVRYVYTLLRKNPHIALYCTPRVLTGMLRRHNISRRIKDYHHAIYKEFPFKVGNFEVTAFEVSHDGSDNAGYYITSGDFSFAVATDLGCVTDRVDYYMRRASHIMLESNYDLDMLHNGPYPFHLQARIEAFTGHLDNKVTARFLADIYTPRLKHVFLCHLSHENNTPEAALATVCAALRETGVHSIGDGSDSIESRDAAVQVVALPRHESSPLFLLEMQEM
ncbi:MAG: MBL fold metallo-hydrolase [Paramuribaculum sp.]|nr:MBL fold metallo-hydrolase [Paramuribaculum sp.]